MFEVNRMGNQEREAQSVIKEWWRFIGTYTKDEDRREWIRNLKWWQTIPLILATLLVTLLLLMMLPFAWLYEKTR
tara:strand:+ start:1161 stop:1385 length:225 start_codon:yes stop_codon:yes gene_type:complete